MPRPSYTMPEATKKKISNANLGKKQKHKLGRIRNLSDEEKKLRNKLLAEMEVTG